MEMLKCTRCGKEFEYRTGRKARFCEKCRKVEKAERRRQATPQVMDVRTEDGMTVTRLEPGQGTGEKVSLSHHEDNHWIFAKQDKRRAWLHQPVWNGAADHYEFGDCSTCSNMDGGECKVLRREGNPYCAWFKEMV